MKEIWKDIEGLNGLYQISNLGSVRRLYRISKSNRPIKKGKYDAHLQPIIMKQYLSNYWYPSVCITINKQKFRFKIHRLIAQAFIPNPENKPCINHKNSIPTDNRIENLEWCTHRENMEHASRNNRFPERKGVMSARAKLTEYQVRRILRNKEKLKPKQWSTKFMVSVSTINSIVYRRNWKHIKI